MYTRGDAGKPLSYKLRPWIIRMGRIVINEFTASFVWVNKPPNHRNWRDCQSK